MTRSPPTRNVLALPLLVALAAPLACGLTGPDVAFRAGTVRFLPVEGGCWVIEAEMETYDPVDLPREFRVDGLRVVFSGDVREGVATICQVGPVLELESIERIRG